MRTQERRIEIEPIEILVVDDEDEMSKLIRLVFPNWIVHYNSEGAELLNFLQAHTNIKCILLDISLPGKDGLALLREIHQALPFLPVIMMTAYNDMTNIRMAMRFGAFDFLTKPFELDDLRTSVLNAVTHREVVTTVQTSIEKTESVLYDAIRILTEGMRIAAQINQHPKGTIE